MEKRKRRADHKKTHALPPPSDLGAHSSQDSLLQQKSSHVDGNAMKPITSIMESLDNPVEVSQECQLDLHSEPNCSRAMLLKHHHHYYGRHYSRRSSFSRFKASTSHGKGTSLGDEKLSFVLSKSRDQAFCKPEKVMHSFLAKDAAASSDATRLVCSICGQLLRKNMAVVAVLVCGHAYHADCLERRTCHENLPDPPCPLCASLLQIGDASAVHECGTRMV